MRKLFFLIILMFLIIYSGCSTQSKKQNVLFKGEGAFWKAELVQNLSNNKMFVYILTYKNPDSKNIEAVSYSFKTTLAESIGKTGLDNNKSIIHTTADLSIRRQDVITVTVKWKDKKDVFKMLNVQ